MKQKIKTWLIHKLGGVTKEDEKLAIYKWYKDGRRDKNDEIKAYAESLNGCDAESWCLQVWNYINTHC